MTENSDIMHVLQEREIDDLLILLKKCLPESIVIYNWILKHREWSSLIGEIRVQILSPSKDFSQHCAIVGVCRGVADKVYGVVFCTIEYGETLRNCLLTTSLIPWLEFSHFTGVIERHALIMKLVMQEKGFKTTADEISSSFLLHIPIEKALEQNIPKIPDNFTLSPVSMTYLPEAVDIWQDYKKVVHKMFEHNYSAGLFQDTREGVKKLIAMNVQAEYGGISILQTAPQFQRFGFGSIVLTSLTRNLAEHGVHPHAHVRQENVRSLGLFKKCGYQILDKSSWIFIRKQ